MKSLLRPFAVLVAALLSLGVCYSNYSGDAVLAASSVSHPDPVPVDAGTPVSPPADTVIIPGPLRSFLRMAGISQKISPDDVLPLLARNVYLRGYQGNSRTEFLVLVDRYVHQARELQVLAGSSSTIRVANCDEAGPLIQILGYRMREGCGQKGKDVVLETQDPERAFLTIDSGFPLTDLEEALQKGVPFVYPFPRSRVPVLLKESDWVTLSPVAKKGSRDLVDVLVDDPAVARLYWALSKNDAETRLALRRSPGLRRLLP
jgi:hypothetical protein